MTELHAVAQPEETLDEKAAAAESQRMAQLQRDAAVNNLVGKMFQELQTRAMTASIPFPPELQRYSHCLMTGFANVLVSLHADVIRQCAEMIADSKELVPSQTVV